MIANHIQEEVDLNEPQMTFTLVKGSGKLIKNMSEGEAKEYFEEIITNVVRENSRVLMDDYLLGRFQEYHSESLDKLKEYETRLTEKIQHFDAKIHEESVNHANRLVEVVKNVKECLRKDGDAIMAKLIDKHSTTFDQSCDKWAVQFDTMLSKQMETLNRTFSDGIKSTVDLVKDEFQKDWELFIDNIDQRTSKLEQRLENLENFKKYVETHNKN